MVPGTLNVLQLSIQVILILLDTFSQSISTHVTSHHLHHETEHWREEQTVPLPPQFLPPKTELSWVLKLQIRKVFFFPTCIWETWALSQWQIQRQFFLLLAIKHAFWNWWKNILWKPTQQSLLLIKLVTNSSTNESIRVKTIRTQRPYIPFLSTLNNYPKHTFF